MSTSAIITICASVCAAAITLLLLVGALFGGNIKERVYRWFFLMIIFNLTGSAAELISMPLVGSPGGAVAVALRVCDFINYACGSLMLMSFAMYLYEYISLKMAVSKTPYLMAIVFNALNIVLMLVASFTGMFAVLDESNYYYPQGIIWVTQILPVLSMLVLLFVTYRPLRQQRPREWVSLLFYLLVQIACYAIDNTHPDVWVAYFGSSAALFVLYINIQVEMKTKMKQQELELTESRVVVMLSQIQPHFLYNSLAAIDKLIYVDPDEAHEALVTFADYLRGNMDSLAIKEPVLFEKELEHIRLYLWLEQLRFGKRLNVTYDIECSVFTLPALTVQPIVENAVRHGVSKRPQGGTVTIRTERDGEFFRIIITDDGVGFNPDDPQLDGRSHMGIANVRSRLETMCDGRLAVASVPGKGTTATIEVPKRGRGSHENNCS